MQCDGAFIAVNDREGAMALIARSSISPARQHLVEVMQELGDGHVESLDVEDGEPVLDPPPLVVKTIVLDRETAPGQAPPNGDIVMSDPTARLFRLFDQFRSLRVIRLDVRDGRMCRMDILDRSRPPARGELCRT